jgi:hypothetical protein
MVVLVSKIAIEIESLHMSSIYFYQFVTKERSCYITKLFVIEFSLLSHLLSHEESPEHDAISVERISFRHISWSRM